MYKDKDMKNTNVNEYLSNVIATDQRNMHKKSKEKYSAPVHFNSEFINNTVTSLDITV